LSVNEITAIESASEQPASGPACAAGTRETPSLLRTGRGALTLALLLLVQFLDFLDVSIVNVALPSMEHELGFSEQSLQWVVSGYVLTYGGFLLLGAPPTSSAAAACWSAASSCLRSPRSSAAPPTRKQS
jgi:hypothetical protein